MDTLSRRVLGVTADGLGLSCVIVVDGEVVERSAEPPLDLVLDGVSFARLARLIRQSDVAAAGLGLASVRGTDEAQRLQAQLTASTGAAVVVSDDTEAALAGAFSGRPGIVVLAQTGSNACGRDAAGRTARVGGHGHLVGDEGSAYWIAAQAIRAALLSNEGRGKKCAALEDALEHAYGMRLAAIARLLHESANDLRPMTRAARVVLAVDDPVVHNLRTQAAEHLAHHADSLLQQLGPLPVSMYGSVFQDPTLRSQFVAATGAVEATAHPEFGATLIATAGLHDRGARTD